MAMTVATADVLPRARTVVGVIDSGWRRGVHDQRVLPGICVQASSSGGISVGTDDEDRNGHGSACTDLILRLAPSVCVMPIRIFGARLEASPRALIAAIEWGVDAGVRLLSISASMERPEWASRLHEVCASVSRQNVLIVAAARNRNGGCDLPACFECVLGVRTLPGAAPYEVRYFPGEAVELAASGTHPIRDGRGARRLASGTSFAAAVVSGHVARMVWHNPDTSAVEARRKFMLR